MKSSNTKTVGEFSITAGVVSGPAEYMREQGNAKLRSIESGADVVFNTGIMLSPDIETAVLVSLQTNYAGWKGARMMRRLRSR